MEFSKCIQKYRNYENIMSPLYNAKQFDVDWPDMLTVNLKSRSDTVWLAKAVSLFSVNTDGYPGFLNLFSSLFSIVLLHIS